MDDTERVRCAICAAETREAARLLATIVRHMTVVGVQNRTIEFRFDAGLALHDRLCLWGAKHEDLEDDTPLERTY